MSLSSSYQESFSYLHEKRKFIYIILSIFMMSSILGYLFPSLFERYVLSLIKDIMDKTEGLGFIEMFLYIVQNNILTSLTGFASGILLGIFPVTVALLNGYVLGYVMNKAITIQGLAAFGKLIPHGIFELPAVFIALALGMNLGMTIFKKKKRKQFFIYNLEKSLKVMLSIVIPLLLIAGIIETVLIFLIK